MKIPMLTETTTIITTTSATISPLLSPVLLEDGPTRYWIRDKILCIRKIVVCCIGTLYVYTYLEHSDSHQDLVTMLHHWYSSTQIEFVQIHLAIHSPPDKRQSDLIPLYYLHTRNGLHSYLPVQYKSLHNNKISD